MYCKDCEYNEKGICFQVDAYEEEGCAWLDEDWNNPDLHVSDTFGCIKFKKKITRMPQ